MFLMLTVRPDRPATGPRAWPQGVMITFRAELDAAFLKTS